MTLYKTALIATLVSFAAMLLPMQANAASDAGDLVTQRKQRAWFIYKQALDLSEIFVKHSVTQHNGKWSIVRKMPEVPSDAMIQELGLKITQLVQQSYNTEFDGMVQNKPRYENTLGKRITVATSPVAAAFMVAPLVELLLPPQYSGTANGAAAATSAGWLVVSSFWNSWKDGSNFELAEDIRNNPALKSAMIQQQGPQFLEFSKNMRDLSLAFLAVMEKRGFRFKTVDGDSIIDSKNRADLKDEQETSKIGMSFLDKINNLLGDAQEENVSKKGFWQQRREEKQVQQAVISLIRLLAAVERGAPVQTVCDLWLR